MTALDSPTLLSLAGRVESLTGPCRETDALIAMASGLKDDNYWPWQSSRPKGTLLKPEINFWKQRAPNYTASLDTAMTLARTNREAMLMLHVAFRDYDGEELDEPTNLFPQIRAMLAYYLRARSALEASHDL